MLDLCLALGETVADYATNWRISHMEQPSMEINIKGTCVE